jgi:hypothetical protein
MYEEESEEEVDPSVSSIWDSVVEQVTELI